MFTVKVRFQRATSEPDGPELIVDETILFWPADRITVNRCTNPGEMSDSWYASGAVLIDWRSYTDVASSEAGERQYWRDVKLVEIAYGDNSTWVLATQAWLLGPDGGTIERIAP